MGFYGNMSDANRSTLQFDKIYPNKTAMDAGCATDGVFVGRYVLVDYDYGGNGYSNNFNQDDGASVNKGRGWDSTVWKKIYQNGALTYIMIAELNAVVPTLTQTTLAPSADGASVGFTPVTNVEYNLAIKAPWGMRIGSIDFNADGFNKNTQTKVNRNNTISVTSVSSGTKYNGVVAEDTYQLDINLPGIGNTISDVWDLLYGTDRNTNVAWGSTTGHRAISKDENENLIYVPEEMNTVAGIINSVHDLIGMNVNIIQALPDDVSNWEENYIYYVEDISDSNNNGFYYKAKQYGNGGVDNGFIAKPLPELGKNLNTLHGLILAINKKLASGDQNILDDTTVQGAINLLNKTRIELSGIVNGDSEYITATSDSNGETTVSHKTLSSREIAPLIDVSNDAAKYSYYPTVDGAGHVTAINRKEITLSALGIDGLSGRVSNNEGAITTLQGKIGQVGNTDLQSQVDDINDKIGSSSDSVTQNTVYGAINAVSAKIGDKTNPDENTVYKAIADLNSTISDEVTTQLSEVTSLIRKDSETDTIIIGDNDTDKIELKDGYVLKNQINTAYFNINDQKILSTAQEIEYIDINLWNNLENYDSNRKIYIIQNIAASALVRIDNVFIEDYGLDLNQYINIESNKIIFNNDVNDMMNSNKTITVFYTYKTGSFDNDYSLTFGSRDTSKTLGNYSVSFGTSNIASGDYSYAEGRSVKSRGLASHAEGNETTASGNNSHAQNIGTIAGSEAQTAIGKYNIAENDYSETKHALIIGNGQDNNNRSNALTVDWNGNVICGKINNININTLNSNISTLNENISAVQNVANQAQQMIESFGSRSKWEIIVDNYNTGNATTNKTLDNEAHFSDYAWLMLCGAVSNSNNESLGINIVTTEFIPTSLFQTGTKFSISGNDGTSRRVSVTYVDDTTVQVANRSSLNLTIIGFKI